LTSALYTAFRLGGIVGTGGASLTIRLATAALGAEAPLLGGAVVGTFATELVVALATERVVTLDRAGGTPTVAHSAAASNAAIDSAVSGMVASPRTRRYSAMAAPYMINSSGV
jgi:hypothetical protein